MNNNEINGLVSKILNDDTVFKNLCELAYSQGFNKNNWKKRFKRNNGEIGELAYEFAGKFGNIIGQGFKISADNYREIVTHFYIEFFERYGDGRKVSGQSDIEENFMQNLIDCQVCKGNIWGGET